MSLFSRFIGTGSYFPSNVVTNKDLEKSIDTTDEWIVTRTGIRERRVSTGESTVDMAYEASLNALDMAGITVEDLDGIIFATFTPDRTLPSAACALQGRLGLANGSFAFDVTAACTGFIYACSVADMFITTGKAKNILVVGAERLSSVVDWTDRGTCILFGDGAGAAVLTADSTPGLRSTHLYAGGAHAELLKLDAFGTNYFANRSTMDLEANLVKMKGNEVFKIAVRAMADAADTAVAASGLSYDDIDYLIPHQANLRIIDATAKRLKLDSDKVIINLDTYGNTSAATIPTAFDGAWRDGTLKPGMNVVSAAFGGGLTWGSMIFTL